MHIQDPHPGTQDRAAPGLSVISDRLPASASQQLSVTMQPPPSHPIDSEKSPSGTNTHTSQMQSRADMMPIALTCLSI